MCAALHLRQVAQAAGFPGAAWVRWGSFNVYGVKLHLLCVTNEVSAHLARRFSGILKPIQENPEGGEFACQPPSITNM